MIKLFILFILIYSFLESHSTKSFSCSKPKFLNKSILRKPREILIKDPRQIQIKNYQKKMELYNLNLEKFYIRVQKYLKKEEKYDKCINDFLSKEIKFIEQHKKTIEFIID